MTGKPSLLTAILAVQAEAPTLRKDKTNPHFKSSYTPLDTVVETIGPILNKHGLVWITRPSHNDGNPVLRYELIHAETGEGMTDEIPLLLSKADAQGLGSAITYARRYSLCAVLNLVADDDDDGNAARSGDRFEKPTDRQLSFLRQLVTKSRADHQTLRLLLDRTGGEGIEIREGWMKVLTKQQASNLIEAFKEGVLPDGSQDIPTDPPSAQIEEAPTDDLPFEDARA